MGTNPNRQTHVKRPSRSSYVQHPHAHLFIKGGLFTFGLMIMFVGLLYGTLDKSITISIDGKKQTIQTSHWTVQHILEEQGIEVSEYDDLSVALNGTIKHGDTISIDRAKSLKVIVDGTMQEIRTTEKDVRAVLKSQHITFDADDKISPALLEPIEDNMQIQVTRIVKVVEHQEEMVPYETIEKKDNKLVQGKSEIVQAGRKGVLTKIFEKVYENGRLVATELLHEEVHLEKVDEVIAIGTREPVMLLSAASPVIEEVTKDGITFGIKRKLEGVKLTAYDAGFNSTGKNQDHPQYGITYTGTRVQAGRTAAVDPKVIPLGWWFYIEGYGFRKAEDIGSGVKGKHIDIYLEEEADANKFGLKKGYTVYIIGPNHPEQQ